MDVPVNYLAVLVGAISNMVIGFLWYGPLFGKTWMKLSGIKMGDGKGSPTMGYITTFIVALIAAYVLSHFIYLTSKGFGIEMSIPSAISTAFWGWLGLVVPATVGIVSWEGKPWTLWFLNAGYWLLTLLAMAAIIASMGI